MNEALRQLEALLSQASAVPARFAPNSRYHGLPVLQLQGPDGRPVAYVARRFIPDPTRLALAAEHQVVQGDRLDLLAARYLADPEQWWKIADANGAMRPEDLCQAIGEALRIALPEGFTGPAGR